MPVTSPSWRDPSASALAPSRWIQTHRWWPPSGGQKQNQFWTRDPTEGRTNIFKIHFLNLVNLAHKNTLSKKHSTEQKRNKKTQRKRIFILMNFSNHDTKKHRKKTLEPALCAGLLEVVPGCLTSQTQTVPSVQPLQTPLLARQSIILKLLMLLQASKKATA